MSSDTTNFKHGHSAYVKHKCRCDVCVTAQNTYQREHYSQNADKINRQTTLRAKMHPRRLEIDAYKRDTPCKDCNNYYPHYNMQFDHVRGDKLFEVSAKNANCSNKYSDAVWWEEVSKCDLVCTHCHQVRTYFRAACNT